METNQTPQPTPPVEQKTTSWPKIVLAAVLGFGLLAASAYAGYWYGTQGISNLKNQISNPQPKTQNQVTPTPTPAPLFEATPTPDPTANWKSYTSDMFSFKYPTNITLEERQKNYLVLLADPENPQSVVVSIDARLTGNYSNYDNAVASTRAGLTAIQTQDTSNGIKISGKVGQGYGEGQQITVALFRYQQGAIEVETTSTDPTQLQAFDQILSTFKFLD